MKKDMSNVSDGNHTFKELYDHRSVLFAALVNCYSEDSWKSKKYDDGKEIEDDYFLAGIKAGSAIRYHIKMKFWDLFNCKELVVAPKWDGSSPNDCLETLETEYCGQSPVDEDADFYDFFLHF